MPLRLVFWLAGLSQQATSLHKCNKTHKKHTRQAYAALASFLRNRTLKTHVVASNAAMAPSTSSKTCEVLMSPTHRMSKTTATNLGGTRRHPESGTQDTRLCASRAPVADKQVLVQVTDLPVLPPEAD